MKVRVALGLGSNQGDRMAHLRLAVRRLVERGVLEEIRCSPVIETAAWLKPHSPPEWDVPFLNLVVEGRSPLSAREALSRCQVIEREAGRGATHELWSPRTLDIDLLAWGEDEWNEPDLTIPHADLRRRPFVLDPWIHLDPSFRLPGLGSSDDLLASRRALGGARPVLMAIVNVTPDSFSDGGRFFTDDDLRARLRALLDEAPPILDLGGQSTRPGAEVVSLEEEWSRVNRALDLVHDLVHVVGPVRPWISVDTFRPEIARRALEKGVSLINDVSGLDDPAMVELAAGSRAQFVFMHHLGVPVDRTRCLPLDRDPVVEVREWALTKIDTLSRAGVDPGRLIFDPGIGFGKLAPQSLELIRRARELRTLPVRVLVGHSRKSYQRQTDPSGAADREAITLAHSLHLARAGVEILRVHDFRSHRSALLADEQLVFT